MAFCMNCGAKLEDDAKFCPSCGTKAGDAPKAAVESPAPSPLPQAAASELQANKSPWAYFCGVYKKYAVFNGRARRAEYWGFALFFGIFWAPCYIISLILFSDPDNYPASMVFSGIMWVFYLASLLPALACAVRRMHDVDKRGWFLLVPVYGLVLACTAGTVGSNRFGPDPKQSN